MLDAPVFRTMAVAAQLPRLGEASRSMPVSARTPTARDLLTDLDSILALFLAPTGSAAVVALRLIHCPGLRIPPAWLSELVCGSVQTNRKGGERDSAA